MEGFVVLKSDVRLSMTKMKRNKTARPNGIVVEILSTLDIIIDK